MIHHLLIALYLVIPSMPGTPRESIRLESFTLDQACEYAKNRGEIWHLYASGFPDRLKLHYEKIDCSGRKP